MFVAMALFKFIFQTKAWESMLSLALYHMHAICLMYKLVPKCLHYHHENLAVYVCEINCIKYSNHTI